MQKRILWIFGILILFSSIDIYSQCTPGDSISCPDPEKNGQICPKEMPIGYVSVPYVQVVTILPPPTTDVGGNPVLLNKIVIVSIANLPPGLSWVSNSPGNEFKIGKYYCIKISGTPTKTGVYPLKITIDAYITIMGNPVYAGTQIDSTSIVMGIGWDPNGLNENNASSVYSLLPSPNPFSENINLGFYSKQNAESWLKIYDVRGKVIETKLLLLNVGQNFHEFNGKHLPAGIYLYTLFDGKSQIQGKIIKTD